MRRVRREDQPGIDPVRSCLQPLRELDFPVLTQCLNANVGEHERSPALGGLELLQHKLFAYALQLLTNADFPTLQIDADLPATIVTFPNRSLTLSAPFFATWLVPLSTYSRVYIRC